MADYSSAFSPSFKANTFVDAGFSSPQLVTTQAINLDNINFDAVDSLEFNPVAFAPGLDLMGSSSGGWTFITAPEDVSWDIANQAGRVDIFGSNNPPVVAGSRGMRDLTLSNSLVEGFMRNASVEGKVASLEALMNYSLNTADGFVSVPVYQVWADKKSYGGANAYFIIRDVKVKETMRDLSGKSTRAFVDISLMQVPKYQVNSGRDQASQVTSAAGSAIKQDYESKVNQNVAGAANKGGANPAAAATKAAAGAGAAPTANAAPAVAPRPEGQRFGPLPTK